MAGSIAVVKIDAENCRIITTAERTERAHINELYSRLSSLKQQAKTTADDYAAQIAEFQDMIAKAKAAGVESKQYDLEAGEIIAK